MMANLLWFSLNKIKTLMSAVFARINWQLLIVDKRVS